MLQRHVLVKPFKLRLLERADWQRLKVKKLRVRWVLFREDQVAERDRQQHFST